MRKTILPIIIFLFLFGVMSPIGMPSVSYGVNFAQENGLPSPGLTPDSPFYFFDTLGEKIGMFFTFGAEKKAEKALKYAEEKLAEVKVMAEKNKTQALEKANKGYQEFLSLANQKIKETKEKGKDIGELAALITEKTLRHQEVLVEVFEKVPEQAKTAIQKAIEVSKKGFEEAVEAVSRVKKEELQKKAEEIKIKVETADLSSKALATEDWKVYRNEQYGFELKYPKEWREPLETKPPYPAEGVLYSYLVGFYRSTGPEGFEVTIYEKPSDLDYAGVDEGVGLPQKGKEIPEVCPKPTREVSIGAENYPAKIVYVSPEDVCFRETYFYILQKGNYDYILIPIPNGGIGYVGYDGKAETEKHLPEFYQMLSTFKFLK